ncbi:hypothetical protein [uncultured Corynebacterium sp.]|nr:hypothetical protein [uncultured Corynebacterium sp.]
MNGKPRDVVVWADSRHQRKKQIGGATITWRAGLTREIEAKVRFHGVEFR